MFSFYPKDLEDGLKRAHLDALARKSRLRVVVGGAAFPVIRLTQDGFSLPGDAPQLRGLVDLYDGARHLAQCLVIASTEAPGETRYEYKRRTEAASSPALDFVRDVLAPAALIPRF